MGPMLSPVVNIINFDTTISYTFIMFVKLTHGVNVVKLFTALGYEFS
jgi:hypothetical protein